MNLGICLLRVKKRVKKMTTHQAEVADDAQIAQTTQAY
jgi:hypothetical protein